MRTVSQRWQIGGGAVAGVGTSKEAVSYPATEGVLTETTTPEEALTQGKIVTIVHFIHIQHFMYIVHNFSQIIA